MTIQSAQVSVSTTTVALVSGGVNGMHVRISNPAGPAVYLGGSFTGTANAGTTGYQMLGTTSLDVSLEAHETLYAIAPTGTATLHLLEIGA